MALIECPECKKQISDQADSCPGCGYPVIGKQIGVKPKSMDKTKTLLSSSINICYKNYFKILLYSLGLHMILLANIYLFLFYIPQKSGCFLMIILGIPSLYIQSSLWYGYFELLLKIAKSQSSRFVDIFKCFSAWKLKTTAFLISALLTLATYVLIMLLLVNLFGDGFGRTEIGGAIYMPIKTTIFVLGMYYYYLLASGFVSAKSGLKIVAYGALKNAKALVMANVILVVLYRLPLTFFIDQSYLLYKHPYQWGEVDYINAIPLLAAFVYYSFVYVLGISIMISLFVKIFGKNINLKPMSRYNTVRGIIFGKEINH